MAYGALKPAFFLLCLPLLLTLAFFLGGRRFEENSSLKSDLAMAEKAIKARDIGDAEMFYERYLRKNPAGEQRWDVWQSLLSISLNIRQDKATAKNYLEIMLLESRGPAQTPGNPKQLADLCDDLRLYDRAVTLWEALWKIRAHPLKTRLSFTESSPRLYAPPRVHHGRRCARLVPEARSFAFHQSGRPVRRG